MAHFLNSPKTLGTINFSENEPMFITNIKQYVKVIDRNKNECVVPLYDGYVCPKCGERIFFEDAKTGGFCYGLYNSVKKIRNVRLHNDYEHVLKCDEPLHLYKCEVIDKITQKLIGKYRRSPLMTPWGNFKRNHTTRPYTDRDWSAKGYRLKYNFCYVEDIVDDETDETIYEPKVKFRMLRPKTNDGARRSSGWKNNKKKKRQWY